MTGKHVCSQCCSEYKSKSKIKTHQQYLLDLANKHPNIIPLENYINSETKILHKCLVHNKEWKVTPNHLLHSCGCSECRREKQRLKIAKGHEIYAKELEEKNIIYIPLEEYQNNKISILHKCPICLYEWKAKPNNILRGSGCPRCSGNIGKTNEGYIDLVKKNNPNIEVLEEYNSKKKNIKCKCIKHNIIWNANAANILNGGGCQLCGNEQASIKRRKSNQQFIDELKIYNPTIISLEEYKGRSHKILFKCLKCGREWKAYAGDVLQGCGCINCNKSKGENKIEQWLNEHNIIFEQQKKFDDCCDQLPLPFDFYLPQKNTCIEFDGIQHFEPIARFGGQENLEYTQRHDQIKNEYCKQNNIPLLRIPYNADIEAELEKFLFN